MKQVYRLYLIFLIIAILPACNDSTVSDGASNSLLSYEMIHFSRKSGMCLGDPDVTKENEHCVTIEVNYPEIENTPVPDMRDQLNTKISDVILSGTADEVRPNNIEQMAYLFIQDFKKEAEDSTANWNLKKDIKVLLNTPQMISFEVNDSGYMGGAHGYANTSFMNIDLDIMQEIQLSDLLLPGYEAELNLAGEKIFRKLHDLPSDASLYDADFRFENDQFSLNNNFAVTKNGLLFYFNTYDIAPYAMGATEILIPYSQIQNLIDPNGLLAPFITNSSSAS